MKKSLQIFLMVAFVLVACALLSRFLPKNSDSSIYAATGSGDICTQQGLTGYPIVSPAGESCCETDYAIAAFGTPMRSGHDACCSTTDTTDVTWPGVVKAPKTVPYFHQVSPGITQADCCITGDDANPSAVQTPCGTNGGGAAACCIAGQVCVGTGETAYCKTQSDYKCDNNKCILVTNPALYNNDPDCTPDPNQPKNQTPCCSANFPDNAPPIVSLCPTHASAKMTYKCCYPGQCYQPSPNTGDCCSSGTSKICGKAPNQLCCNSIAGSTPIQDCMAKTGKCCNEGPYVGDIDPKDQVCGTISCSDDQICDKSIDSTTGQPKNVCIPRPLVSKVCGCGPTDTKCTCCGANQACDTDIDPKTKTKADPEGKPYDICEGMPSVTCSLSPVQGFLDSPTNTTVKTGTTVTVSAKATSNPTSPDFQYNWTENISSTPPVNKSVAVGPQGGPNSWTYKAIYDTDFTVNVWNGVGTSNTAECKIHATDNLKIYCGASSSKGLPLSATANVDMDEPITLFGAIDPVANGLPKYTYTWSPSNSMPINSTTNCPSNPDREATNTNTPGANCDGKATLTPSQKAQICFNPDADPVASTKTVSVIDSAGTTASDTCTINIEPQPALTVTCNPSKQKIISRTKTTVWNNTLHCYPYITVLSIPVTVTGQITNSVTSFCSVEGNNAPVPSIDSSGKTVFSPSCTGNTQNITETFTSCLINLSDISATVNATTDSITATSDCQSGSANKCTFKAPLTTLTISMNDNLTLFLSSLLNMLGFK